MVLCHGSLGKLLQSLPYKMLNKYYWKEGIVPFFTLLLFSRSVVSDSLWSHGLRHTRFPCPSLSLEFAQIHVRWVDDAIQPFSSSVTSFSSWPQSFPASGSFPMNQLFASGGQSIGVSASSLVLPMNIQDWLPLGLTGLISLQSKGLLGVFSSIIIQKQQFFSTQLSLWIKLLASPNWSVLTDVLFPLNWVYGTFLEASYNCLQITKD